MYGTRVAVLAGDFLFAESSAGLANLDNLEVRRPPHSAPFAPSPGPALAPRPSARPLYSLQPRLCW